MTFHNFFLDLLKDNQQDVWSGFFPKWKNNKIWFMDLQKSTWTCQRIKSMCHDWVQLMIIETEGSGKKKSGYMKVWELVGLRSHPKRDRYKVPKAPMYIYCSMLAFTVAF